jgi:5'-3' exonuclease
MGIKGNFRQYLLKTWPNVFEEVFMDTFSEKSIAVDIIGLIYSYKACFGDNWLENLKSYFDKHTKKYKISFVIIFEGKAPVEKNKEQCERKKKKELLSQKINNLTSDLSEYEKSGETSELLGDVMNKICRPKTPTLATFAKVIENEILFEEDSTTEDIVDNVKNYISRLEKQIVYITSFDIIQLENVCLELNMKMIKANGEAEQLCSWLCQNGHVDAVWSEDSDLIALQCPIVLSRSKVSGKMLKFVFSNLLSSSSLTVEQIVDWAILCGTDYNTPLKKIGVVRALEIIQKYKNIDEFINNGQTIHEQYKLTNESFEALNYQYCRNVFLNFEPPTIDLPLNKFAIE